MKKYNKHWLALVAVFAMGAANADPIEITLTATVEFFSAGFGLNAGDAFDIVVLVDSTLSDLASGFDVFDTLTGLLDISFTFDGTVYSLSNIDPAFLPFAPSISILEGMLFDFTYWSADTIVVTYGLIFDAADFETFDFLIAGMTLSSITEVAVPEPGTLALLGLGLLGMLASRRRKLATS